jgi:type II secretory pathway pseudopilin PulG
MKIKNVNKRKSGFSLIEAVVYVAILGMFIFSFVTFMNMITYSRVNNQVVLETNNQGNQIVKIITQSIRNAVSVNSPSEGSVSNSLSLETNTNNPVVFYENSGTLYVTEGSNPAVALTNNSVSISNLTFANLSQTLTSDSVQIRFTLTSTNQNANITSNPVNFYGSASIRK